MKKFFLRVLSGVVGLAACLFAILGPLSFYANESMEHASARQYNGQSDLWAGIGGWLTILFIAAFSGFVGYYLLRFSLKRSNSK